MSVSYYYNEILHSCKEETFTFFLYLSYTLLLDWLQDKHAMKVLTELNYIKLDWFFWIISIFWGMM